jgi:hypothetical protein
MNASEPLRGLLVRLLDLGRRSELARAAASERFLTTDGKWPGSAYLFYSRCRRYVSLDGKGVDLGGCWSPGSSPGMIARER